MSSKRRIPLWISIMAGVLVLFMLPQIYMFYFNHDMLVDAGINIDSIPSLNIMYTTAGRLVAMSAITLFAIFSQNPNHFMMVFLLGILREGQETFIDPLLPYANAQGSPILDFSIHILIVALEIWAFLTVYKIAKREKQILEVSAQRQLNHGNARNT